MWWFALWKDGLGSLQWSVVLGGALIAACTDLRANRIPNAITLPMIGCGLAWATWTAGLAGFGDALVALVLLASPYLYLYLFRGGGAGDAKMMGALGAWVGVVNGLGILFCVSLSGVLLAIAWMLVAPRFTIRTPDGPAEVRNAARAASGTVGQGCAMPQLSASQSARGQLMPYGIAIFAGVCAWLSIVRFWIG